MDDGETFLDAVKRGDAEAVARSVGARPELVRFSDDHGKTGLHWAAEADLIDVARLLLDAGSDIEAKTSWGASPLDWAATMGSARVAELLLSRGAQGYTLITAAALGQLEDVVRWIESAGDLGSHRRRDAPTAPDDHWTPDSAHILGDVLSDALYASARNGHLEVIEHLLSRGADVDAKGVFGATALHWAAINGHGEVVRLLLARGARVDTRDARFSCTPEDWANEGGHREIARILRGERGSRHR